MYQVYKHTCANTGKSYIGITTNMARRTKQHQQHPGCVAFHRAIKLHGWSSFVTEILGAVDQLSEALEMEERFILVHNALSPDGYNLKTGGQYKILSKESRSKISEWNRTRVRTPEMYQKIASANRGKIISEHTRAKLSVAGRGRKQSVEHVAKRILAITGRQHSEETRKKTSDVRKGRPALTKGIPRSEETKRKMSDTKRKNREQKNG